jgi:hypothetical protein
MLTKKLFAALFKAYLIYSVCADLIVIAGIFYLIFGG